MKKPILSAVLFFALAGCSEQLLDYRNTELSNGMFYGKGENTPFTGTVTNVPLTIMPTKSLNDMLGYARLVSGDDSLTNLFTVTSIASLLGQGSSSAVLCETHVEDGYLTGEAICTTATGGHEVADIEYAAGTIEGKVTLYSLKGEGGSTLATGNFVSGKLHGDLKVYGFKTKKLVSETTWKNGILDGWAKIYSNDTGNLIAEGMVRNNKREGKWKVYDPDTGKFERSLMYKDGQEIEQQETAQFEKAKKMLMKSLSTPTTGTKRLPPRDTSVSTESNAERQLKLDTAITHMIERQIAEDGGAEYLDGRKVLKADLNGDNLEDSVVLYTIEGMGGGNFAVQTMALFFEMDGNYVLQDSVDLGNVFDFILDGNQTIQITTLTHSPYDADCCPSLHERASYRVENGKLVRTR